MPLLLLLDMDPFSACRILLTLFTGYTVQRSRQQLKTFIYFAVYEIDRAILGVVLAQVNETALDSVRKKPVQSGTLSALHTPERRLRQSSS